MMMMSGFSSAVADSEPDLRKLSEIDETKIAKPSGKNVARTLRR
jgi:hypothetical protein